MHTITECPWCGKDFMYHQSDVHLFKPVAFDPVSNEPVSFAPICQDCYEAEHRGWENAECMAADIFDEMSVRSAMNLLEKGLIHFN